MGTPQSSQSTPPDTLPANFAGWDKPPDTLPANFSGWDQQPAKPTTTWQEFKSRMPGLSDIGKALTPDVPQTFGDALKQGLKASLGPAPIIAKAVGSMGKEAVRGVKGVFSGDPTEQAEAGLHLASAMNPFSAPVTDQMSQQGLGTKQANATGLVGAGTLAAGEVAGNVLPKTAGVLRTAGKYMEDNAEAAGKFMEHPIQSTLRVGTKAAIKTAGRTLQDIAGPADTAEGSAAAAPQAAQPNASPAPSVKPSTLEPANYLTFHGAEDGETAALMQLTHTGGQGLRAIAQARGLKIPAAADNVQIINRIKGDLSPEEIQSFADAAEQRAQTKQQSLATLNPDIVQANKGVAQKLYDEADKMQAAGESPYRIRAWRTAAEAIETRPTPVTDILGDPSALRSIRGVDKRMALHIQEVTGTTQNVPVAQSQSPYVQAAKNGLPNGATDAHVQQTADVLADHDEWTAEALQKQIDQIQARKASVQSTGVNDMASAPQGGHAGGGTVSVEELNRPGTNFVINKGNQVTYQGKSFAPESTPPGGAHVTVLPNGQFRVNAGTLTPQQGLALKRTLFELSKK